MPYHGLSKLSYPFHDRTITVTQCIWIREGSRSLAKTRLGSWQETGFEESEREEHSVRPHFLQPDFGKNEERPALITCCLSGLEDQ